MRILVAVTGGIAAYKAVELVRELQRGGADVRVLQTRASREFVGPATFAALTGRPVVVDVDEPAADGTYPHLDAARDIDCMVVAPATAASIARMATGDARDVLGATYLGCDAPVVVAAAMNVRMWRHAATRRNVATLRADGVHVIDPDAGELACGDVGEGRLPEPAALARHVLGLLTGGAPAGDAPTGRHDLDGLRILVTAGGTREPIDSVRAITNRSSGRMGVAIAAAAHARGAEVDLVVTSSVSAEVLAGAGIEPTAVVEDTAQLAEATHRIAHHCDAVVMAAAVSDFTVATAGTGKLERGATTSLALEPTEDIIARLARERGGAERPLLVGFAAETGTDGIARARTKRERKGIDVIVHNDVARADIGFESPDNEVTIIDASGEHAVGLAPKRAVADAILDRLIAVLP